MAYNEARQFYELASKSKSPLIILNKNYCADAHAVALALFALLPKMGAKPEIFSSSVADTHLFSFLPAAANIRNQVVSPQKTVITFEGLKQHPRIEHKIDERGFHIHVFNDNATGEKNSVKLTDSVFRHDLIITIGLPDLEAIGEFYDNNSDLFYRTPIINIDHSPENEHYGQLNLINLTATSISELVYELINELDPKLFDDNIATCLLAGMIEKTKSFRSPKVTPRSLQIASGLMAIGANRERIIQQLYQTKSVGTLKLWGRILMRLTTNDSQKLAHAEINETDFKETGTDETMLPALIEELIASIPTIEISAIFYEKENQKYCLVITEKNIDLRRLVETQNCQSQKNCVTKLITGENEVFLHELATFCS